MTVLAYSCTSLVRRERVAQRTLLLLLVTLTIPLISASAQVTTPSASLSDPQLKAPALISQSKNQVEPGYESILAARAFASLKRLDDDVLIYRSLGDFEADGRLARVSYNVFRIDLQEVIAEVEPILSHLSENKLKLELINALCSYRDGGFWWGKIHRTTRVVSVSTMNFTETSTTRSDAVFMSSVPYTIAIHWRQAGKYLERAEKLLNEKK